MSKEQPVSLFSVVTRVRNGQAQNQGLVFCCDHKDKNENGEPPVVPVL